MIVIWVDSDLKHDKKEFSNLIDAFVFVLDHVKDGYAVTIKLF